MSQHSKQQRSSIRDINPIDDQLITHQKYIEKNQPIQEKYLSVYKNSYPQNNNYSKYQSKKVYQPFYDDDKWLKTRKYGIPIKVADGVYITAFKCPLSKKFDRFFDDKQRLHCWDIKRHYKVKHGLKLKAVFDLTNTDKYYDHYDFNKLDICTFKYKSPGK